MTEQTFTEAKYNKLSNQDRNWNSFVRTSDGYVARRSTATLEGDINVDSTSVSTSGIIGKASGTNADFTTAYASGTTLTCSSLPSGVSAIKADDIVSIVQVATSGAVTQTYTRDDATITAAGTDPTTLTVAGATFVASDSFIVYTNIPQTRGDKVDLIEVAGTATNVNGGNRDAGTQTITLADNDPAVTSLAILDDWDAVEDAAIGTDGATVIFKARSSQQTAMTADNDAVIPVTNLYGETIIAGYTYATTSNRTEEISPLSSKYTATSLADTTNVSAATHYYPSATGSSMDGYKDLSFTGKLIDADETLTLTIEAMNDEDTTSGDWIDITPSGYKPDDNSTGNSNITVTNGTETFAIDFGNLNYKYYRVKLVAGGATNTVIIKERKKAL